MSAVLRDADREREFAFGPTDHRAIADLVHAEAGIVLPPAKAQLVYGRLARRVRSSGVADFADYVALLGRDHEERAAAIDALTTNHTSFFRENHHFEQFMADLWPALSDRLASGGRVRLWSSACSSGEEPFSWLMAILGGDRIAAGRLAQRDFRMLATDVSPRIVAQATAGRYATDTVKAVSGRLRTAWLRRVEDGVEIDPMLRALVTFRELNLLRDWPMRQRFDAIFCRNVMIYFDEPTKARLQARLADRLLPGGCLYIGHSERLVAEVASRFVCLGHTIYRKVGA